MRYHAQTAVRLKENAEVADLERAANTADQLLVLLHDTDHLLDSGRSAAREERD